MTLVTLVAGAGRYGIDVRHVEGVIPVPRLRPLAMTPPWVAGVFSLAEQLVPVIDLCRLHGGQPARLRLGTRVIVSRYPLADGSTRPLGLLAERVTDVVETGEETRPGPIAHRDAAWLGDLVPDGDLGLVQLVNPVELLTDEVKATLFPR